MPRLRSDKPRLHLVVALAPLLALVAVCLTACGGRGDALVSPAERASSPTPGVVFLPERSAPYVTVSEVSGDGAEARIRAPGRVAFRDDAVSEVGAPIEGRVAALNVRVGQRVAEGDVLVTLLSPDAAAARQELAAAEIGLRAAQDSLRRQEELMKRGVGIERERFEAEIRVTEAQAQVARAEAAVAFLGQGRGGEVKVRAPIAGQVVDRRASIGAAVEPGGDPLVVLGDPSALWVVADVFERDLPYIREGASVSLSLSSIPDPVVGTVEAVGAAVQMDLRRAPVFISIPDDARERLRPGMYARAAITADALDGVTLPVHAVLLKDGRRSVIYVETEPRVFQARDVRIGQAVDGFVQVISGVAAGERVAVEGALLLDGVADTLL